MYLPLWACKEVVIDRGKYDEQATRLYTQTHVSFQGKSPETPEKSPASSEVGLCSGWVIQLWVLDPACDLGRSPEPSK